ncbi:pollen-specific leucine-rich repeat extensin 1 [Olea europaea subsp. europaea]|uniref:Pollen-specific leucine-rich repeat extensin 1 n=2 Tax=Olea europaea subsp. europaea TaxID=158383 RepID=A0A8S0RRK9_OLEEU|nr:pollen-specific leucine-rich repeat extensin 1 [Olea europaea subsp. europaea]
MAEKKTVMVLNVDLKCPCCYKKIQKILCKIPQISDRTFNEKENTVTITVICCSPEKIRDKLICKGGKIIKSIEIKKEAAPKPKDDKPKDDKPKDDKTKPAEQKPKGAEKLEPKPEAAAKPKSNGKGNAPPPPAAEKPKDAPNPQPPKNPAPVPPPGVGLPLVYPVNPCCGPCYEGRGGGPCYHGYGFPPPPSQVSYDGNYGPGYVYGRPCYVSRCDYFSEENSTGCTIM